VLLLKKIIINKYASQIYEVVGYDVVFCVYFVRMSVEELRFRGQNMAMACVIIFVYASKRIDRESSSSSSISSSAVKTNSLLRQWQLRWIYL